LSKRAGEIIGLDEIVDEVGSDVTRFIYLMQSVDTRQTFDLVKAVEQSMENPVYYVQYAHARLHSILRKAAAAGVERGSLDDTDLSLLTHESELGLLRVLSEFSDTVESACNDRAPHRITTWVRELASAFHTFYRDCYVIGDVSPELTQARLWLLEASRLGLLAGLDLLGVSAPEEM
ncbi:MAG: DALR anticodon-binding domain-containing protein, partial [Acidimicrobiales bacterium]